MNTRKEKLSNLAAKSVSIAARGLSSAQTAASSATAAAVSAGKASKEAISEFIDHEDTQAVVLKATEFANLAKNGAVDLGAAAAIEAKSMATAAGRSAIKLGDNVVSAVKKADQNHEEIAGKVDGVSMGLGIAGGVAAAGAKLTAIPLLVAASPAIGAAATVAGTVAGTAYFYSKWKSLMATQIPPLVATSNSSTQSAA